MENIATFHQPWTPAQKIFFRFFTIYFFLFLVPFPLNIIPGLDELLQKLTDFIWDPMVYFTGKHILHIPYAITVKPNGSGDTTYNYVQQFLFVILSVIGTIGWSLADRNRASYNKCLQWLIIGLRYYLAFTMFGYGFAKVIKTQFPFPGPYSLLESYGQSSPMHLAWAFVGYSDGYNQFTGWAEVIGGLLLLFRKTTLIGALLVIVIMSNVMAINFCFDVPVKLYSMNLVLMAMFLLVPHANRMRHFFISNTTAPPAVLQFILQKRWQRITRRIVRLVIILSTLYLNISGNMDYYKQIKNKPPLYGIYDVESFTRNRDTLPPLTSDTARWKKLIVSYANSAHIQRMNDSLKIYAFKTDTVKKLITLYTNKDTVNKSFLHYSFPDSAHLMIVGKIKQDSVFIRMKRFDMNRFLLVNRGFHWINEYPMNR